METHDTLTPAEIGDRHRTLLSGAFLAIGCGYAAGAAGHLMDQARVLRWLEIGTTSVGVVLVLWAMFWKARKLGGRSAPYLGEEGFVAKTITKAHVASWVATFITLSLLKILSDDTELPTEFFLQVVLAVMLLVHGLVFFALNRPEPDDTFEDGGHA